MPLETEVSRPTRFQALVIAACAKLDEILEAEGRALPTVAFGKVNWTEGMRAPRIHWIHEGGSFTLEANVPGTPEDAPVPALGFRVTRTQVALWHVSPEHVEHMLERLWMATDRAEGGDAFRWQTATYDYPTEVQGPWLQNGHSVIVLRLPIELDVAGSFDGEIETVEVASTAIRTGIESPAGEAESATGYEVNQWVDPDKYSDS